MDARARRRERLLQKSEARMNALLGKNKEQNSRSGKKPSGSIGSIGSIIYDDNNSSNFVHDSKTENGMEKSGEIQQIDTQKNDKSNNDPEIGNGEHIECDINCSVNKVSVDENDQQNRKINETKPNEQEQSITEKENTGVNEVENNNSSFLSDLNFVEQGQTFWYLINLGMGILNYSFSNDQTNMKPLEETRENSNIYVNSLKTKQFTLLIITSFCFSFLKYKYIYSIHGNDDDDNNNNNNSDVIFIPFLKYAPQNKICHLVNSPQFFICFAFIFNIILLLTSTFYKCFKNKNWKSNWNEGFKLFHRFQNTDEQNSGIFIWTLKSASSMFPFLLNVTKSFVFSIFFIFLFDDIFYNNHVSLSRQHKSPAV